MSGVLASKRACELPAQVSELKLVDVSNFHRGQIRRKDRKKRGGLSGVELDNAQAKIMGRSGHVICRCHAKVTRQEPSCSKIKNFKTLISEH